MAGPSPTSRSTWALAISPISCAPSISPPGFRRGSSATPRAGCAIFSKNGWRCTDYPGLHLSSAVKRNGPGDHHVRPYRLKVGNLDASVRFYKAALAPLGFELCSRDDSGAGFGPKGEPALWLYRHNGAAGAGTHIAFRASD